MTVGESAGGKVGRCYNLSSSEARMESQAHMFEASYFHLRQSPAPGKSSSSHDQNTEGLEDAGRARFRHHDVIHCLQNIPHVHAFCVCVMYVYMCVFACTFLHVHMHVVCT